MEQEEITALFDRQAPSYDQQWSRLSALNGALHLLTNAVLGGLPPKASILCVGAGTGAEILQFADRFPGWRFTAVEPSQPMLDVFRQKAEGHGILSRCAFHAGYLDSLPGDQDFDAATAFLVSQFILDRGARSAFFQGIADRLRQGGILVSSDLAGDLGEAETQQLLRLWFTLMSGEGGVPEEGVERMREAYSRDVAVLPPDDVREIITQGGFEAPTHFFQAGMVHAWSAIRSAS